jgi:Flp pilus assembly protein TadG
MLKRCKSGNATMLVAMGMPVLIGGTGFAVDTAQWYMWKRELQFATDQAAIAAAWALTDTDTEDSYVTRGTQEYDANLATTVDYASNPAFQLANFAGGDMNSVIVTASVTRELPFSSLILGAPTTVATYSQAQFGEGTTFTSCLVAVDEDADGAITVGGNTVLTAGCGMAALSTSDSSIVANGNPEVSIGHILSAGGIDDWFDENTDDVILEYMEGLYDPFEDLSPPDNPTIRTYSCPSGGTSTTTTADVTEVTTTSYTYYVGNPHSRVQFYPNPPRSVGGTDISGPQNQLVPNGTLAGTYPTVEAPVYFNYSGNGTNRLWERTDQTTETTYANVVVTNGTSAASVLPGTYTDMNLSCDTVFTGGIYVIDGGDLEIHSQYDVTGAGVMFVLKNGAGINGGSNVNLTAMTVAELMDHGVSQADAGDLAGMLVFEDRDSEGNQNNKINGNAETVLNGTIYLPISNIDFQGTASVTSQCLMIAANTITFTGTTDMTNFCPAGVDLDDTVAETGATVRLVA